MNSIKRTLRCTAVTVRDGSTHQCKHMTTRGIYCWQHENTERHLQITKDNLPRRPGYGGQWGLFTTERIPAGRVITEYTGDKSHSDLNGAPYALKVAKKTFIDARQTDEPGEGRWVKSAPGRQNAEFVKQKDRVFAYATKDIPAKTEIVAPHVIATMPMPKKKSATKKPKRLRHMAPQPRITSEELAYQLRKVYGELGMKVPIFETPAQAKRHLRSAQIALTHKQSAQPTVIRIPKPADYDPLRFLRRTHPSKRVIPKKYVPKSTHTVLPKRAPLAQ